MSPSRKKPVYPWDHHHPTLASVPATAPTPAPLALSDAAALAPLEINTERTAQVIERRIGMLAGHMSHQLTQHQRAMTNSNRLFDELLDDLNTTAETFRTAFNARDVAAEQIYTEVDPDRSVGILRVLWHSISFTTRGNRQPLALFRPGRDPLFTGRILAMRGDFQDITLTWDPQQFHELLPFEISSLYVPADETEPAIMKVPHLGEQEWYFPQEEAARLFLMKTVEMVCSGGFLHEQG